MSDDEAVIEAQGCADLGSLVLLLRQEIDFVHEVKTELLEIQELKDLLLIGGKFDCVGLMEKCFNASRDPQTIERLLNNASQIYAECAPATLNNDDVSFVNRLMKERPQELLLPGTDIAVNRDEFRKRQDAVAEQEEAQDAAAPNSRVPYGQGLHELVKLAIGLQTLRVMGQVLRNFPGVLTAEPKLKLTEASYLLGLRILRRVLSLAEHQMQALRTNFAEILKESHPLSTQEELEKGADQILIWLTGAASYGVIKRICRSVGLKDLELTFEEVRTKLGDSSAVRLIHLSIVLEYFRDAPKSQIYELETLLRKNYFSYKILRDLVSEFLYLRNMDFRKSGACLR